jgi:hypothetical protein
MVASDEVYASGWQGISHWSPQKHAWEVELATRSYNITTISAYPTGGTDWDVWAAGQPGDKNDPNRMIYHLKRPSRTWEVMTASGVEIDPAQGGLRDILLTDFKTGFAVGPGGAIVKGSKQKDGGWSWSALRSPTNRNLNSICYADHALWIVGAEGKVLRTADLGQTWQTYTLTNDAGNAPDLFRIRSSSDALWIVGRRVVYRYHFPSRKQSPV